MFITAGPITKLFAGGGGGEWTTCAMIDDEREIVGKKEGEQKGSARGSVHWGCYYATALDIEVCVGLLSRNERDSDES